MDGLISVLGLRFLAGLLLKQNEKAARGAIVAFSNPEKSGVIRKGVVSLHHPNTNSGNTLYDSQSSLYTIFAL